MSTISNGLLAIFSIRASRPTPNWSLANRRVKNLLSGVSPPRISSHIMPIMPFTVAIGCSLITCATGAMLVSADDMLPATADAPRRDRIVSNT